MGISRLYLESIIENVKKHEPEILVSLGINGLITSVVMALKKKRKSNNYLRLHGKSSRRKIALQRIQA